MFKKTIIADFFTTVSLSQALQSLYLMTFWSYKLRYEKDMGLFEKEFLEKIIPSPQPSPLRERVQKELFPKIISFYNWRSAIFHALKMIWVKSEDEVIVNAYNCVSVSNAIIQSGAKIIYSDIETETLSFDFEVLKKNISPKTKVIIIQHTFWKRARDFEKIVSFAREKWILIIEDCAHSLSPHSVYPKGREVAALWDFQIYSTGRDKVISSVTWWFLVIPQSNPLIKERELEEKILKIKKTLKMPSLLLTLKNLNYNIAWYFAYKLYDFLKLWKIIIFLSRKLSLITEILTSNEKRCNFQKFYLDFPNALAYLARKELKKLDEYTEKRLENIKYYMENISPHLASPKGRGIKWFLNNENYNWFRFPILLKSKEEKNRLVKLARQNNILLWTTWSWTNIAPIWTDFKKAQYKLWSCPIAEDISKRILTIPNHKLITKKDLTRVIEILNKF